MKYKSILALAVVSALGGGIYWWQHQATSSSSAAEPVRVKRPPTVLLSPLGAKPVSIRLGSNGTVTALDRLELRPQTSGVIRSLRVREGQEVAVGDVLVQLDDAAEAAQLAKARAQLAANQALLNSARRDLARSRELLQQQFISQSALDTVQSKAEALAANLAADRAQIAAMQVEVGRKTLRAPVAGRVGAISLSPGALVQPGMTSPLLVITRVDPVAVSFSLPEQQLAAVRQSQQKEALTVYAQSEADGRCHQGRLSFIDSAVDSNSGNVLLKAQFDNAGQALWPGQFVRVTLDAGRYRDALTMPVSALLTGPDGQFAYVVDKDNKAQRVPLTLLAIQDEQAIVRGLAADAQVVSSGGQNIRPGELVNIGKGGKGAKGKGQGGAKGGADTPASDKPQLKQCPPPKDKVGRKDEASAAVGKAR